MLPGLHRFRGVFTTEITDVCLFSFSETIVWTSCLTRRRSSRGAAFFVEYIFVSFSLIKNLPYYLTCTLCPKKKEESLLRPPSISVPELPVRSDIGTVGLYVSSCLFFGSLFLCIVFVSFLESFQFFTIFKCPLCALTRSIPSFR